MLKRSLGKGSNMAQDHPKSVQHALKVAEKHGSEKAKKEGIDWEGKSIAGVKVTKKDFSHGHIHDKCSNKEPNT